MEPLVQESLPSSISLDQAVFEHDLVDLQEIISNPLTEVLDFRALHYWNDKLKSAPVSSTSSSSESLQVDEVSQEILIKRAKFLNHMEPPNEFDWLAWDQMGKIMPTTHACEIFAIIKGSKSESVKELLLNARRDPFLGYPLVHMPEALSQMKSLTKLVLRGLTDNLVLKVIGRYIPGLKYLDISYSQLVTDEGIFKLLFKDDIRLTSGVTLIPTWVQKNLQNMWPLTTTLEYFDFNFTATSQARKLIQMIPGCYTFKRLLSGNDPEGNGHFIFMRRAPDLSIPIRFYDIEDAFEAELQKFVGKRGAGAFLKYVRRHPWRSSNLALYKEIHTKTSAHASHGIKPEDGPVTIGIVTPSKEEKRINGIVVFQSEALCELYSVFTINLNHLAQACYGQRLKRLTGFISDTCRQDGFMFSLLIKMDIFSEPETFLSMLLICPNLKTVRVRILRKPLMSHKLFESLNQSVCRNCLEELWIAPGSYKKPSGFRQSFTTSSLLSMNSLPENSIISFSEDFRRSAVAISDISLFHYDLAEGIPEKDNRIENLVQLSTGCVQKILGQCVKLKRLGNLCLWNISESDLEELCIYLEGSGAEVNLLWHHLVAPAGCKFINGKVYSLI